MPPSDYSTLQIVGAASAAASVVFSLIALKYNDRPAFYEHPKGIPHKKGYPLLGNLTTVLNNVHRFHDFESEIHEELDSLTLTMAVAGSPRGIITIDPQNVDHVLRVNFKNYLKGPQFKDALHELLGNGIFNANGETWKYQRKAASHIFNVKNFRDEFTNVFVKEMHVMCDKILDKAVDESSIVDFHEIMFKFTLDSFVYLGFGVQLDSLLKTEKVPFAISFDHLQRLGAQRFINPFMPINEACSKIFKPWKMSTNDHVHSVDSFAESVISKRRQEIAAGKNNHIDLLSRFMNTTNEHSEKLNDIELRDTVLNFIIAGRDTTAQALSWLFYNLALHPRVEKKIMEEIGDKISDDESDSAALYEIINELPYMHAVFYETLRLHPSVPTNQKYTLEDDVWPDGTVVKAGDYISWSPYAQGRSRKIWGENAKEFYPERWINEEGILRRESASKWPAFNAGPRVCLGQNLAVIEALVCISMLLKRYSFKLVPGQDVTYDISLTLPMKNGMKVYVEKR